MKEHPTTPELMQSFTEVETIIPEIKPSFAIEPPEEQYRAIKPYDAASEIERALRESEKIKEFFREFSGQIVVEIGPGELLSGYNVASLSNAKAYVGVEPFAFFRNLKRFLEDADKFSAAPMIPRSCIQADALSFLKRLPDKSVSIFASQIGINVMQQKYREAVISEIERVLNPNGALIEYDSYFQLDNNLFQQEPSLDSEKENLTWKLQKFKRKNI